MNESHSQKKNHFSVGLMPTENVAFFLPLNRTLRTLKFLPRDAMRKRGLCCGLVSVRLSV